MQDLSLDEAENHSRAVEEDRAELSARVFPPLTNQVRETHQVQNEVSADVTFLHREVPHFLDLDLLHREGWILVQS